MIWAQPLGHVSKMLRIRDVNPHDTVFGLMDRACTDQRVPLSEEYPWKYTLAELTSLCGPIRLVNHHSEWPARVRQIRGVSPPE